MERKPLPPPEIQPDTEAEKQLIREVRVGAGGRTAGRGACQESISRRMSCQSHHHAGGGTTVPLLELRKAQRGAMTCPKSHSEGASELGLRKLQRLVHFILVGEQKGAWGHLQERCLLSIVGRGGCGLMKAEKAVLIVGMTCAKARRSE